MDQSPAAAAQRLAVNKCALIRAVRTGDTETVADLLDRGVPIDTKDDEGKCLLHWAAEGGHVTTMRLLIRRGCDVDSVDDRGDTPLHWAAAMGQTKAVRELIRMEATKSVVAEDRCTPLHRASVKGHAETVVAMLEEGFLIDAVDSVEATVLHFAAQGGHVEVIKLLVGRGCDVNAVKANGCTPLHDAAGCGKTEAVHELIKLGATKSVIAGNCGTPLHQAALEGHVETVEGMLAEGCPIDVVDSNGATVLHFAAAGGHVELVRMLVDRGCDVNAVSANGCTPLHDAAENGRTEAVHELIKLGATKSVVAGNCGTPLDQAALEGHVETVEGMLAEGCPIDVVDSNGATVLHFAAYGGHVEVLRMLVDRECDVNAVQANGYTPLHDAAENGRTEAVRELIRLGASKSAVASGALGTPLHQAVLKGHVETIEAILECKSDHEMTRCDVVPLEAEISEHVGMMSECNVIDTRDSTGLTPLMWATFCGQVEAFKFLTSKGGAITDRDTHSVSTLEQCFVGGHASKLSQFCEACGIGSSGEGLRGTLATLITSGLIDASKVLCLCAITGESAFLEEQFSELVASDTSVFPGAVKFAKYYFDKGEGVPFLNQLHIPDEDALSPLHISILSMKCFKMGFDGHVVDNSAMDHTSFITKLLSHPVLKKSVNEHFPNGLSLLDLARRFELPNIAALIEGAGGRPGVWADIPHEIEDKHPQALPQLKEAYASIKAIADDGEYGQEFIKRVFSSILGGQPVYSVGYAADDSQLVNEQVLGQCPDLGDVVAHVLPHIQVRHWKRVGLALGMKECTLDGLGQQFPNDDDRYLETLSYWLEHGSSVTWKTLLDVLGLSEVECTMVKLRGKIVSELGGAHQVSPQLASSSRSLVHIERTAELSWPLAKRRRTSDEEGVPWQRKRSPECDTQDHPPAKTVAGWDLSDSGRIVEAVSVPTSAPVVSGGTVATERSPPVCEATLVQVVQKHAERFLKEMNCKAIVAELRALELVPESVESDIHCSKSREQGNAVLLNYLKEDADEETVTKVFRMASEKAGYKKMNTFAAFMLRKLEEGAVHVPPPGGAAGGQVTSIQDVTHPSEALGEKADSKWRRLGTFLRFEPSLLDTIQRANSKSVTDCMLDLVTKWVDKYEGSGDLPRTWQTVVKAVRKLRSRKLAEELAKTYGVSNDVETGVDRQIPLGGSTESQPVPLDSSSACPHTSQLQPPPPKRAKTVGKRKPIPAKKKAKKRSSSQSTSQKQLRNFWPGSNPTTPSLQRDETLQLQDRESQIDSSQPAGHPSLLRPTHSSSSSSLGIFSGSSGEMACEPFSQPSDCSSDTEDMPPPAKRSKATHSSSSLGSAGRGSEETLFHFGDCPSDTEDMAPPAKRSKATHSSSSLGSVSRGSEETLSQPAVHVPPPGGQVTSIQDVTHASEALGGKADSKWRRFGTFLRFEPSLLDTIQSDNTKSVTDCMLDLVTKWVDKYEGSGDLPRTRQTVVEAVRKLKDRKLAEELAKTYGVSNDAETGVDRQIPPGGSLPHARLCNRGYAFGLRIRRRQSRKLLNQTVAMSYRVQRRRRLGQHYLHQLLLLKKNRDQRTPETCCMANLRGHLPRRRKKSTPLYSSLRNC